MPDVYANLAEMVVSGREEEIYRDTEQALREGAQPRDILNKGLLYGMAVVGQRFKNGDMFVPEVILSANTMHAAMDALKPFLSEADQAGSGTIIIGTVEGDVHNVGKDLVAMILEGAGFKVLNLGVNVKPEMFVEKVKACKPDIVAMSSLLTTTMPKMAETIIALQEAGLQEKIKVMAGGAPISEKFVMEIGGDGYAVNALSAVEKAQELMAR